MKARGKTMVVTGAGNGIGRALTLDLLSRGARVAALDMNEKALQETFALSGDQQANLSIHVVNITDKEAITHLYTQLLLRWTNVDGVINNAGIIQPFVSVNSLDYAVIERVMNVNFYGTLFLTKTFLPHLLQRPEAHIVNISSMGGFLPVPGQSVYGASKAAVKLLTEGLQAELRETQVKVTVVFPGAIGTNIIANSGAANPNKPLPTPETANARTLSPSKAAKIILDGMEKNRKRVFAGNDSRLLDIMYRINPSFATNLVAKQIKSHNLMED